jgi:hypothetical protein
VKDDWKSTKLMTSKKNNYRQQLGVRWARTDKTPKPKANGRSNDPLVACPIFIGRTYYMPSTLMGLSYSYLRAYLEGF